MTLFDTIDILKKMCLEQPDVRMALDGDVFENLNSNPSVRYACVNMTQTSHSEEDGFDRYGLSIFYIDRLTDDRQNRLQIQSAGKEILQNVIDYFCDEFDADRTVLTFTPFTQKFKDECAGVWCNVELTIGRQYSCPEGYSDGAWKPVIEVVNNTDITVTVNGVYEPSEGFTGFGKVVVDVDVPVIEGEQKLNLQAGDRGTLLPSQGFDGFSEVSYEVEPNEAYRELEVDDNGTYVIEPSEGFGGLDDVTVRVNIPLQEKAAEIGENGSFTILPDPEYRAMEKVDVVVDLQMQEKEVNITSNGTYTVTKDEGFAGMDRVDVNVNVTTQEKMPLYNGVSFLNSTFTEFPFRNYDWSMVYDGNYLFMNCQNLVNGDEFVDMIASGEVPLRTMCQMMKDVNVERIEGIDFTKYGILSTDAFRNSSSTNLKLVKNCKLYGDNFLNDSQLNARFVDCDWSTVMEWDNYQYGFIDVKDLSSYTGTSFALSTCTVLDCERPSSLTTLRQVNYNSSMVWYRPDSGWEDVQLNLLESFRSFAVPFGFGPVIDYSYNAPSDDDTVVWDGEYASDDLLTELVKGADNQFSVPYVEEDDGSWIFNGIRTGISGYTKDMNGITIIKPSSVPILHAEGESIFSMLWFLNQGWAYDAEKEAVCSTLKDANKTQDMRIQVFGDTMTLVYGQSSEKNYDYMSILDEYGREIWNAKGSDADNLTATITGLNNNKYVTFRYSKDLSGSNGEDRAWIRSITYSN